MGFFSDLLNPVKHFKDAKKGISSLASGDVAGFLDPAGHILGSSPKSNPADNAAPMDPALDPAQYMGDTEDPEYGSFTDPFDVENFYEYADPGYAFRLQQGNQAVLNSAAAGSGAMSGAALKDLLKFNQDYASTEYGNAFNRYQTQQGNIFNRLFGLTQLGQNAAAGVGSQGTTAAGNAGQFLSDSGAAYGGGIVGAGNAAGSGLTNYWLMRGAFPEMFKGGVAGAV